VGKNTHIFAFGFLDLKKRRFNHNLKSCTQHKMAENTILGRLNGLKNKFEELGQQLTDPAIIADMKKFVQLNKEYRELEPIVQACDEYRNMLSNIVDARNILANEKDQDLREMAREELATLEEKQPKLEEEIKLLLVPADPQDSKNAVLEIRAGTGGDEASIFAGDLFRMYSKYIENKGWKMEVTSFSEGTVGGYKEIVCKVSGDKVYGTLKYESGVHRVQRVPQTETQGRVHTSAASVAVLPEADEFDVEIKDSDVRVDTFMSSGNGGQSVNTTYSAVRVVHIPTGIVVQCQEEKSQLKNKARAMEELRTRIYNIEYQKYMDEIAGKRKTMVSTGDRSAKIRTYNYPQSRMTDHRIGYTIYNLSAFMDGDIQEVIDHLQMAENAERLKESEL
jgi:peptide chain release factor 1